MKNKEVYIVVAIILFVVAAFISYPYITKETLNIVVTDKERIVKSGDSKYLIYTKEETFENTDSIMYFKFDSSDIYGNIQKNEEYEASVYGFRLPIFSKYRNIISVEEK